MIIRIFLIWIIFQLVVIGGVSSMVYSEINKKTLDCKKETEDELNAILGMTFPLTYFTNVNTDIQKYCIYKK